MAENVTRNHELNNLDRRDKFSHGTRGIDFQGSDPEVAKKFIFGKRWKNQL